MNSVDFSRSSHVIDRDTSEGEMAVSRWDLVDDSPPTVTRILTILRRRKWVIIGAIIGALLLGLIVTLIMTPQYRATSTLEIQRESSSLVDVETSQSRAPLVDQEFYETQYGLLKSRSLADRVAIDLKLIDSPQFFALFGVRKSDSWFSGNRVLTAAPGRADRARIVSDILLGGVAVRPQRLSRLIQLEFTSPDPAFSKRIVDAWAVAFIQVTLERRYDATSYARNFLEKRLGQLRERIDESERRLVGYAAQAGIVNLPASGGGDSSTSAPERSMAADDLAALNTELSRATADRIRAQSRLGAAGGETTEALDNTAIVSLRQRRAELAGEYAKLMVQFEPEYPAAKAVRTQMAQLDQALAREESRVTGTLRESYRASTERENSLSAQVSRLKSGVLDYRRKNIQYNIYQRDVDTNSQLYDALLQRYKAIGVAGGVGVNNISVVDPAEMPQGASSPKLALNMGVALLVGLMAGIGIALALEQIDQGITDPSEVEGAFGVPLLGVIPKVSEETPVEALRDRKSAVAEAYFSLRTNLKFSTSHGVPKTLAVTSTRPAEGKTTTSFALARSLAQPGVNVVIIDADMRSPSLHYLLGGDNLRGLSNFLSGDDEWQSLIRPTEYPNLSLIAAGPQPPSAPELLSGDALDALLVLLLGQFDHVVIDMPPVMGLADAPLIGSRVEGVIMVAESHSTHKNMARVALGRLLSANVNILGIVLTKFNVARAHYGYGYEYGYGYGYGDRAAQ